MIIYGPDTVGKIPEARGEVDAPLGTAETEKDHVKRGRGTATL